METKIVLVRNACFETVDDQPVLTGDKKYSSRMDLLVRRTANLAAEHVEAWRCEAFEQTPLRERTLRLTTPVLHLIQIVDTDCIMRRRSFELTTPMRIVIREPSGIDDQRPAIRCDFDVQQIVVSVATVADWTAVEDEISSAIVPAAALNEITTVRKARTRFCRGGVEKIFTLENRRRELQQIRITSRIGV